MGQVGASLRPSDAASGGFLDAANATITSARFVDSYPNGTARTLLRVAFEPEDGKERTEYYSAGDPAKIKPNADGKSLVPKDARMNSKSGAVKFIGSVIDGGFPLDRINDDISVIDGTKVFLRRKAQPKTGNAEIDAKDRDLLLVERVLALPEEGAKTAKKVTAKVAPKAAPKAATPATPAAAADSGSVQAELEAIVTGILATAPNNTVPRNRIGNAIFQVTVKAKNPNRGPLMTLASNTEYMTSEERPWAFDGESLVGVPVEEAA